MCLSCGCVATGGSPTDDHGDDDNLVLGDLTDAANAQGITLAQAAQNIVDSLAATQAPEPVEDAVMKALAVPGAYPNRFVLGVAYPAARVDGHREWASADSLEQAAWSFARKHRRIGFFHAEGPGIETHADLVESYVWRGPDWETTDISGATQVVKTGDWMLGAILDEPGFGLVLNKKADGWSLDGGARRRRSAPPK